MGKSMPEQVREELVIPCNAKKYVDQVFLNKILEAASYINHIIIDIKNEIENIEDMFRNYDKTPNENLETKLDDCECILQEIVDAFDGFELEHLEILDLFDEYVTEIHSLIDNATSVYYKEK